jgi:hypothetical protein
MCDVCISYEHKERGNKRSFNRSVGSRIPYHEEDKYIEFMVRTIKEWQKQNNKQGWMPSLEHIGQCEGLPSRRAISEHVGPSSKIYKLWFEHGIITSKRYEELITFLVPLPDARSYEEHFLRRVRAWQIHHELTGWIPALAQFTKTPGLPNVRTIRARFGTDTEVYNLLHSRGLITDEVYQELSLFERKRRRKVTAE